MNRRQKLNRQRRTLFPSHVKPRRPYWWPTKEEMNNPDCDNAVNDFIRAEDERILEELLRRHA